MNYLDDVANDLAKKVLADPDNLDDNTVIDLMAAAMGASSATLQESFLTAVRIRRAEIRANVILVKYNAKKQA